MEYFIEKLNKMYSKITDKINPTKASTKLTFSNAFDAYFSLLLREMISLTLANMQEEALELESNLMVTDKIMAKPHYQDGENKKKKKVGPSTLGSKPKDNKIDEMTKLIKSFSSKVTRLEMENKAQSKPIQEGDNQNPK